MQLHKAFPVEIFHPMHFGTPQFGVDPIRTKSDHSIIVRKSQKKILMIVYIVLMASFKQTMSNKK